jgi:hypothetical protein
MDEGNDAARPVRVLPKHNILDSFCRLLTYDWITIGREFSDSESEVPRGGAPC